MHHSVSVVIPNYNGKHLLKENLPSVIAALTKANTDHEIIISDDASTDDSIGFIRENYPQLKTIRSAVNRGFSHTINQGMPLATKSLVLLLNSDVKLKEDYFESQWKYFDNPDTFGVMGSIWSEDGKQLMDAGKYPVWKGAQLRTTVNYRLKAKSNQPCFTLFISGANALVNRKKLQELQGMDERYSPYYMEDVDLSVRAWRKGWLCYYEEEALCYHKLSATVSKHDSKKKVSYISKRNKFIFHYTHLTGIRKLLWTAENSMNLLFRWIIFDWNYYKSYFEYKKIVGGNTTLHTYIKTLQEVTDSILQSTCTLKKELF